MLILFTTLELIETPGLLNSILDTAPNGIVILRCIFGDEGNGIDFPLILINSCALQWADAIEYAGKPYGDVFPMFREKGVLERLAQVAQTAIPAKFNLLHEHKGQSQWLRFTIVKEAELLIIHTEDITAQFRAEALSDKVSYNSDRQKRLYDSITDNTPDLIYVFDLSYKFTYANKALLTMWGKSAEDAIGKGLRENGYQEWHALMHEREIDDVVAFKKPIRGTVSFPHAELGSRIYDYILVPVLNDLGEVEAVAGTTRDITEIKQAENELQRSENRFRNIIDTTHVGAAILTGPEMRIEVANDVMLQYWKRDKDIIGMPLTEAIPELLTQPYPRLLKEVFVTGISHIDTEAIAYIKDINGDLLPSYFSYSYTALRDTDGTIYGVSIVAIDVTRDVLSKKQLEESESRFRSLADESPMFVFIIERDPLAPVSYWNKTYLDYTGQTFEQAQGRAWDGVIHPDDFQTVMDTYIPAFADHQPYFIPAVRAKRKDGVYRWHAFKGNPRYSADGSFNGYIGVGFDVHDQKIIEEKLELLITERTKELLRSNEDLQKFAHVASHDLKEPIRKIKMFTGRLEERLQGVLDQESRLYFKRLNVASDRMSTMVEGVLHYSGFNQAVHDTMAIDLNIVIENVTSDLELLLEERHGEVMYQDLPVINGASVLIHQLFYNLVINSIKFARANVPPHITISSYTDTENDEFVHIVVEDNGIGFNVNHAEKIFETFSRLNTKDQYEGTGLGLSLCKNIVERHGGVITASGIPGRGAKFHIRMPLNQNNKVI